MTQFLNYEENKRIVEVASKMLDTLQENDVADFGQEENGPYISVDTHFFAAALELLEAFSMRYEHYIPLQTGIKLASELH